MNPKLSSMPNESAVAAIKYVYGPSPRLLPNHAHKELKIREYNLVTTKPVGRPKG